MGIINSIGKKFRSIASSPFGNALLTSASRRLSASGLPFGGLFGSQDQNFAINSFDRQGDETDWRVKLTLGGAQNNPLASEMQQPVLQPLADIAPNWVHEVEGVSVSDLLLKCEDQIDVNLYGKIPLHSR